MDRTALLPLLALLLAAAPARAITEHYVLTDASTITPVGGSPAPLSGSFDLARGPLCALPPGLPPVCTDPLQWTPADFDLAGDGLSVESGTIDPIALLLPLPLGGQILLDPVDGLELGPIVLEREILMESETGQVFRELRLAPLDGPGNELVGFDPGIGDLHPDSLHLDYELQERVGTIVIPQPPIVSLPFLDSETITPLAGIELHAVVPEPGAALLVGVACAALGRLGGPRRGEPNRRLRDRSQNAA